MFTHVANSLIAWVLRADRTNRWPLMFVKQPESVATHCFEVGVIAHRIGVYAQALGKDVDANRLVTLALFHEASESGGISDIPGPLKRANPELRKAIKAMERQVEVSMTDSVVDDYSRGIYRGVIVQSEVPSYEKALVKAADELSMLKKCHFEIACHNPEFEAVLQSQKAVVESLCEQFEEVRLFYENDLPACLQSLDELQGM
ncbi:YfbR-like 5'-deoxynucleotidase [Vibrio mediterranei]|uniref:YfbR-like 5'-deoxynucleotidase n=1 Tax=Vibrio mediterranei TaxID=689 RepID=UPI004067D569